MRSDTDTRIALLEQRMNTMATHTDIATVKQEIEEVKTLIAEKQVASLRWTIGTGVGIAAVVIAAIKFLG